MGATALPIMKSCVSEPLTAEGHGFKPCDNPFCKTPTEAKSGKRFCSDRCRMDGYALRRVNALLDRVGVIEFHRILDLL